MQTESEIQKYLIIKLREDSPKIRPDSNFKESLLQKLQQENKQPLFFNFNIMRTKLLLGVIVAVLLVAAAALVLLLGNNLKQTSDNKVAVTPTEEVPQTDDLFGISLPCDVVSSTTAAEAKINFALKLPQTKLGNEVISEVKICRPDTITQEYDSIYVNYSIGGEELYQYSQTSSPRVFDENATTLSVNGTTGYFSVMEDFVPGDVETSEGKLRFFRTFLTWKQGSETFDVSEYGSVSKEDVIKIAESVK